MENIANPVCRLLCRILAAHGVRDAVVSPGSRNAPLLVAMNRCGYFRLYPVVDERTAAFVSLGMALRLSRPVALVCTSGSAVLNYAPALAEAYYRNVPIIAVSADRPSRWIDCLDSQTIRQEGSLGAVVRCSVDINEVAAYDRRLFELAEIRINEALSKAVAPVPGPVHINIRLDAPLTAMSDDGSVFNGRVIRALSPVMTESDPGLQAVAESLRRRRVMVLAAGLAPDSGLADALARCGFPVFAEAQSNLPSAMRIARFDRFLDVLPEDLVPEIVVTIGGALVSARIKNWLRQLKSLRHISVGYADQLPDTFGHLAERVDCPAEVFFSACAEYDGCREYGVRWRNFYENCPLPSPNPISKLFESISSHSAGCDIWLSNGSAIRYAQHCHWNDARVDCNRGVSGIDGCTSTAIGSAMVSPAPTILITGDMSAGYDIGVLLNCRIPETFKIIILDNNGADIFRNISTTGSLDELDSLFVLPHQLPYSDICRHFGGEYYEAEAGKDDIPEDFFRTSAKAMLVVRINPEISKNLL